jgi:uncharacterized protein DUF3302
MTALDIAALLVLVIVGFAVVGLLVALAILPGRIAQRRQHPQTDAIRVAGYLGVLIAPLWVFAFIWAYTRPGIFEVAAAVAAVNERMTMLEERVGIEDRVMTKNK